MTNKYSDEFLRSVNEESVIQLINGLLTGFGWGMSPHGDEMWNLICREAKEILAAKKEYNGRT